MANTDVIYGQHDWYSLPRRGQLDLMDKYYGNNILYETTRLIKSYLSVWNEDIRPLRTPVNRSVEFFVSKIAIGEPVISSKNASVIDAVKKILEWSNFQIQKPLQVRAMSKYGDVFRKVVSEDGKVWHEIIPTAEVVDCTSDTRGFLTSIRIDTAIENGRTRTEYWTALEPTGYMAIWEHSLGEDYDLEQIQRAIDPIMFESLSAFGIDFVPFAKSSFRDDGNKWGASSTEHALLKIDEANRQATRLHGMLFRYNKPLWVVSANQVTDDGSPVAPPKFKQGTNADKTDTASRDNSIFYLPGMTTIESLVPKIAYGEALQILQSQEKELVKDLPELLFYDLPERADLSGKAIRSLLGAAVDRAMQAQTNFLEGTIRLNQMALTIGMFQGIFPAMGSFDDGSLGHALTFGDPFPLDASETGQALKSLTDGGLTLKQAMKKLGFSEEEIQEAIVEKENAEAKQQAQFERNNQFQNNSQ